jgi:2-phosphosulfolactate phosphatase
MSITQTRLFIDGSYAKSAVIANFPPEAMTARVILLPKDLKPADVAGRTVVVFDVVRATTTITAALAGGVAPIRAFGSLDEARAAAAAHDGPKVLCGELKALPPRGFDLGNSPRQWAQAKYAGRTAFISTTNGTHAVTLAQALNPAKMFAGSLVNARAVASAIAQTGHDVTLLCAGSNGNVSLEDLLGAGAVLTELGDRCLPDGDGALIAQRLFTAARTNLPATLRQTAAGRAVISVGLEADLDYCSALNSLPVVGVITRDPLSITAL